jgi:hypothetical protein
MFFRELKVCFKFWAIEESIAYPFKIVCGFKAKPNDSKMGCPIILINKT